MFEHICNENSVLKQLLIPAMHITCTVHLILDFVLQYFMDSLNY